MSPRKWIDPPRWSLASPTTVPWFHFPPYSWLISKSWSRNNELGSPSSIATTSLNFTVTAVWIRVCCPTDFILILDEHLIICMYVCWSASGRRDPIRDRECCHYISYWYADWPLFALFATVNRFQFLLRGRPHLSTANGVRFAGPTGTLEFDFYYTAGSVFNRSQRRRPRDSNLQFPRSICVWKLK